MELKASVTKDGIVFLIEDSDGQTMEVGPIHGAGYRQFLAAVDALDDAASSRDIGETVLLAQTEG
jgi:hypothetical protein